MTLRMVQRRLRAKITAHVGNWPWKYTSIIYHAHYVVGTIAVARLQSTDCRPMAEAMIFKYDQISERLNLSACISRVTNVLTPTKPWHGVRR